MKTTIDINNYASKRALLDKLVSDALGAISPIISTYTKQGEKQLHERAYYTTALSVVNGVLKSKYKNSGDTVYLNLQHGLQAAVNALFNDHSISVCTTHSNGSKSYDVRAASTVNADNAINAYKRIIRSIYSRRIDRSIERSRNTVNIISTDTLKRYFNDNILHYHARDSVHMSFEVVHDIITFLMECHFPLGKLGNDNEHNKRVLSSVWYDCNPRRVRNTSGACVRSDGVYKVDTDGEYKRVLRFRSHLFAGELFNDFATFSENGKHIIVWRYRSLYDAIYAACDTFITRERRNYTSNEPYIIQSDDGEEIDRAALIGYDDGGFIECENKELFRALYKALVNDGVKRPTAHKYTVFTQLLYTGFTRTEAEKIADVTRMTYYTITQKHSQAIRAILE